MLKAEAFQVLELMITDDILGTVQWSCLRNCTIRIIVCVFAIEKLTFRRIEMR